jgi:hypothetical protein
MITKAVQYVRIIFVFAHKYGSYLNRLWGHFDSVLEAFSSDSLFREDAWFLESGSEYSDVFERESRSGQSLSPL